MTGDDGMEVLDLDMELDEHALRVFQLHSQPWLKARLQFYKEKRSCPLFVSHLRTEVKNLDRRSAVAPTVAH